jgi:hypothetical protein
MTIYLRIFGVVSSIASVYILFSGGIQATPKSGGTIHFEGFSLFLLALSPAILGIILFFIAAKPERKDDRQFQLSLVIPFAIAIVATFLSRGS